MKAEIWLGEYFSPFTSTHASPLPAADDLVGHHFLVLGDHRIVDAPADQTLDREQGVLGIGHGLTLGGLAHETLIVGEGDDGRRRAAALGVLDHLGLAAIHDGDAGVGRSKVDTDDFGHMDFLSDGDFTGRVRLWPPGPYPRMEPLA